jgi:hypothetical protein
MKVFHKFLPLGLLLTTTTTQLQAVARETWPCEMPFPSKNSAIRHRTYLGEIDPVEFTWSGEKYKIIEGWIERGKAEKATMLCLRLNKTPPSPFGFTCKDENILDKQRPYFWAFRNWLNNHYVYTFFVPDANVPVLWRMRSIRIQADSAPPSSLRDGATIVTLNLDVHKKE